MRFLRFALLAVVLLAVELRAVDSLRHARQAQAMLGAAVWSQVIRVENTTRWGAYPRIVHALVFELAGILWFYTDVDGTQSFSLHRGRLAEEKADFGPLLRDIEPGFTRWTVVAPEEEPFSQRPADELPNGCFVQSVVALRTRLEQGVLLAEPRLLSYHIEGPRGRLGHTVLVYHLDGRIVVVDPARAEERFSFSSPLGRDPLALARAFQGADVTHARFLPLEAPLGAVAAATPVASRPDTVARG